MRNLRSVALLSLGCGCLLGCVGREAGSRLTTLSGNSQFVEEVPSPANDADYPAIVDPKAPASAAQVTIIAETQFQTLEGFGAALGWYEQSLVGQTPKGLYEFLFPELGLDILRFRNRYDRSDYHEDHAEWDAEIYARANQALGHPIKLMLAGWSPPAALKANQKEKCHGNDDCTLAKEDGKFVYEKFADFWLDTLKHYATLGMVPEYVSIQNEPDFIPPDWEGCKFAPRETSQFAGYDKALEAVHARLKTLNPMPKLLGPEVLGIHYERVQEYVTPMNLSLVYGIAHHIYEKGSDNIWDWRDPGPDSFVDEMEGVANFIKNKPLFQTEFATDDDRGIDGGFETAWLIHHSLVAEGVASFVYWELVWDGSKGLVGMQGKDPHPRDQYYSLRHFARFTEPGYIRVDARSDAKEVIASAFTAPDQRRLTVILLNTAKHTNNVTLNYGTYTPSNLSAYRTIYRPGHSKRWQQLLNITTATALEMPARSVVTIALEK